MFTFLINLKIIVFKNKNYIWLYMIYYFINIRYNNLSDLLKENAISKLIEMTAYLQQYILQKKY